MEISNNGGGEAGSGKRKLPEEAIPIFTEGIYLILSRWSALQLAVENQWGGRGSRSLADQLASDIFAWFTRSKEPLYIDDLEDILDEGMCSLNAIIEDGSIEEVSEKLMIMHEECLQRNYSSVEKLRQAGSSSVSHLCVRQHADNGDDDDDEDEDEDEDDMDDVGTQMIVDSPGLNIKSNPNLQVDASKMEEAETDDGWQVASSKRNRGKKN